MSQLFALVEPPQVLKHVVGITTTGFSTDDTFPPRSAGGSDLDDTQNELIALSVSYYYCKENK